MIAGIAIIPFFARRFRVPSAALEIMFGALLFNTIVETQPGWFQLLKEIGIIYLMFTVGM